MINQNASNLQGKVALITGAARGMGSVTAKALAAQGARLILVDWEGEHGTRLRDEINAGVSPAGEMPAEFIYCDISSMAQVRALAADINSRYKRLDILVNNAGITDPIRRLSEDGHEMHFATCHLAHFLLTHLLLDLIKRSAPSRIIVISSEGHKSGPGLDFDDMGNEKIWQSKAINHSAAFFAYSRAKLCNICFMLDLHERLTGTGVTVNAVSPGYFVNTTIYRNMKGVFRVGAECVFALGSALGLNTPVKGARTHIYLASAPEVETVSGKYFQYCQEIQPSPLADDLQMRERLWDLSEELTGIRPAES